jgi:dolichol-phosphate mannosyltransferase
VKVAIVIPTYNEAENLPKLVSDIFALPLSELNILIVDDNSPDGTGQIAEELAHQWNNRLQVLHRSGKLGLGTAYIQGFKHCLQQGMEAIGQMDADFSHPIEKLTEMIAALQSHDFVLGSRYISGGSLDKSWQFWRKALSAWGNFYARTILHIPIRDVTGGFRIWRSQTLSAIPLERIRSNGYVFQVEMAYVAAKLGFRCKEIPIHFAERKWGKSKMNLRIQIEAAYRVWQLPGQYRDLDKKISLT